MLIKKFVIHNKNEMKKFAAEIAALTVPTEVITLRGDLGVGKTFFSQNFITALIPEVTSVVSPTFLLVLNYQHNNLKINHFDLYRLKAESELQEIGLEDSFGDAISLIEWPEIAESLLPDDRLDLFFARGESEEERKVIAHGYGNWEKKLNE